MKGDGSAGPFGPPQAGGIPAGAVAEWTTPDGETVRGYLLAEGAMIATVARAVDMADAEARLAVLLPAGRFIPGQRVAVLVIRELEG